MGEKLMGKKPGVMLYYSYWSSLRQLDNYDLGAVFRAIMEYDGVNQVELPEKAALFWPLLECQLAVDDQRYRELSERNAYANYVRWQKERGETVLSRSQWQIQKDIGAQ